MRRSVTVLCALVTLAACQADPSGPTSALPMTVSQVITPDGGWMITETDLPTLGYPGSGCGGMPGGGQAYDINAYGDVVGWSCFPSAYGGGIPHAVLWNIASGSIEDLSRGAEVTSMATGINDNGRITGTTNFDPYTLGGGRAFIYDWRIGIKPIGSLGGASSATKINNNTIVVGVSETKAGSSRAFFFGSDSRMHPLGAMIHANDVDDAGLIAGGAIFAGDPAEHAAIAYTDGTIVDYGRKGRRAVLTSGPPLVGNYYMDATPLGASHAFITDLPGDLRPIPTLGGTVNAALGSTAGPAVVGWSEDLDPGRSSIRDAYFWSPVAGTLRLHLSPLSASFSTARAINASWQIVGFRQTQSYATPVVWTVTRIP